MGTPLLAQPQKAKRKKSKFGQKRIRLGAEDLGFRWGHVELERLLRASGGGDRNVTVGFSNMDTTGNFKESRVSEATRFV